jgi:hypothetical protein
MPRDKPHLETWKPSLEVLGRVEKSEAGAEVMVA